MNKLRLTLGLLLPLGFAAAGLYWLMRPVERPDILLVTVDTLRADHLGAYGYDRPVSPNLDALARSATVFDTAFTQASLSGPAHATLMTSLDTPVHGVISNAVMLDDRHTTLAEVLRASGYDTAMFVSHPLVGADYGFGRGFDTIELHTVDSHGKDHAHEYESEREGTESAALDSVFRAARKWIARPRSKPFFVWLHVQHAHKSYDPPAPYDRMFRDAPPASRHDLRCLNTLELHSEGRIRLDEDELAYIVELYDGEIAYLDAQLGGLLDALAADEAGAQAIVVLTADHGEMLFDDPERRATGHGRYRTDPVLRIPLIVRAPGPTPAPARVESLVGLIDVAPTVLDLAGVRKPRGFDGRSLAPLLRGVGASPREASYSCTFHSDGRIRLAVREADSKTICDKRKERWNCELYDLRADPLELHDLATDPDHAAQLEQGRARLDRWFHERAQEGLLARSKPASDKARRLLRLAGYLQEEEP